MGISFTKASACGNDFLIIDGTSAPADLSEFTRRICDRHNGVGADGVEFLFPAQQDAVDVHARLINADGTEAEISGNGTSNGGSWELPYAPQREIYWLHLLLRVPGNAAQAAATLAMALEQTLPGSSNARTSVSR